MTRRRVVRLLLLAAATAGVAACGGRGRPSGAPEFDRDIITAGEIEAANAENVLALVRTRRPTWLRGRGGTSILAEGTLVVYLDGTRLGGPETMRDVTTEGIAMVRFYDAPSANLRFGIGHQHGAIQIVSLVASPRPR